LLTIWCQSIFEAFSTNEILQIVVFSVIFGIALGAYGEKGQMVTDFLDKIAHVVLIMVNYVMWFAPLGVLGAVAAAVAKYGFEIFTLYAHYLLAFVLGIATLWAVLLGLVTWY
jgi:Na+/H+-dicarboxylate symporter